MRRGWHVVEQLAVVQQGDDRHLGADAGQRPVVTAPAPAQPVPAGVHGQRGHQDEGGPRHRVHAAHRFRRLHQALRPGHQRVGAFVGRPVEVPIGPQQRQDDVGTTLPQPEDEAVGVRLTAHREIRGDRTCHLGLRK